MRDNAFVIPSRAEGEDLAFAVKFMQETLRDPRSAGFE